MKLSREEAKYWAIIYAGALSRTAARREEAPGLADMGILELRKRHHCDHEFIDTSRRACSVCGELE